MATTLLCDSSSLRHSIAFPVQLSKHNDSSELTEPITAKTKEIVMIIPFLIFWLAIALGLYGGDLSLIEAAAFVGAWLALLLGLFLLSIHPMWFVAPSALLDIVLILKVFGGDITIR